VVPGSFLGRGLTRERLQGSPWRCPLGAQPACRRCTGPPPLPGIISPRTPAKASLPAGRRRCRAMGTPGVPAGAGPGGARAGRNGRRSTGRGGRRGVAGEGASAAGLGGSPGACTRTAALPLSMPSAFAFFLSGHGAQAQSQSQSQSQSQALVPGAPGPGQGPRAGAWRGQSLDRRRGQSSAANPRPRASRSNSTGSAAGARARESTSRRCPGARRRPHRHWKWAQGRSHQESHAVGLGGSAGLRGAGREAAGRRDGHRGTPVTPAASSLNASALSSGAPRRTHRGRRTGGIPHKVKERGEGVRTGQPGSRRQGRRASQPAAGCGPGTPAAGEAPGAPVQAPAAGGLPVLPSGAPTAPPEVLLLGPGLVGAPLVALQAGRGPGTPRCFQWAHGGGTAELQWEGHESQSLSLSNSAASTPDKLNRRNSRSSTTVHTPDRIKQAYREPPSRSLASRSAQPGAREAQAEPPMLAHSRRSQSQGRGPTGPALAL